MKNLSLWVFRGTSYSVLGSQTDGYYTDYNPENDKPTGDKLYISPKGKDTTGNGSLDVAAVYDCLCAEDKEDRK